MLRRLLLRLAFAEQAPHHERHTNERERRHDGQGAWFLAGAVLLPFTCLAVAGATGNLYIGVGAAIAAVAVPIVLGRIIERSLVGFGFPALFAGRWGRGVRLMLWLAVVAANVAWFKSA